MKILYEDEEIIVCYKPANLATQTRNIAQPDMVSELSNYLLQKKELGEVHVVHRLDQPVEGVMVFAKNSRVAADLSKQITEHEFVKRYYAVVSNMDFPESGELTDYIIKDAKTNLSRVVDRSNKSAKKASLRYTTVDVWNVAKLLEIELYTGRHHQIRVQLSSRKAPILGDIKYGGINTGRALALCSHYIKFKHPKTKKVMEFDINPLGEDFLSSNLVKGGTD